jgi:hypothetical protein
MSPEQWHIGQTIPVVRRGLNMREKRMAIQRSG